LGDLDGDRFNIGEVGVAVLGGRGADGDEHSIGRADRAGKRCAEGEGAFRLAAQEFFEVILVDGDTALLQGLDLGHVVIDADYGVAHFRKAYGRDESYITTAHDRDAHRRIGGRCGLEPSIP
jgi:hypothetical protein